MLENVASAVIIPSYETMNSALESLHTNAIAFSANVDATTLSNLRAAFVDAYIQFQHSKMFNFGPAEDYGVKAAMDTYPTDTASIEANITAGSYILGSAANIDAIGLPALDYLLYFGGDMEVLDQFTTAPAAANRKIYLTDLTLKMKSEFQPVVDQWNGTYAATFQEADGVDVGSSTSLLFNEFVQDIELLKNAQIGIPGGQFSGGEPLQEMVSAYFSGQSKTLALENISGLLNCFKGANGLGFDDYILDVQGEDAQTDLAADITAQFVLIEAKLNALGSVFSEDVMTNYSGFNAAFLEIKKLVTYTKTDMASLLGLLVTYSDSDGD